MQPLSGSVLAEPDTLAPVPLQASKVRTRARTAKQTRERLVLLSMGLVTAAAAGALYVVLSYSLAEAVLAGGGVWAILVTAHLHNRHTAEISRLKAEIQKLEALRGGALGGGQTADGDGNPNRAGVGRRGRSGRPGTAADGPRLQTPSTVANGPAPSGPQPHPRWEVPGRSGSELVRPASANETAQHAQAGPHVVETALWPGTALSAADPMRDQWAFRPREGVEGQAESQIDSEDGSIAAPVASSSIDADLAMVQRKIKALADEVNATDAARDRGAAAPSAAHTLDSTAASAETSSILEASIGELKATAQTMRSGPPRGQQSHRQPSKPAAAPASNQTAMPLPQGQALPFELLIPATAERIAVSQPSETAQDRPAVPLDDPLQPAFELPTLPTLEMPAAPPAPNTRIAAIVSALQNGEMDVFLSPIVALQSHQVSHYDVTVRLKSATGGYIDNAEQELQLAGSDVLALFDTARLRRAASLAQRLDAHNKSGSLLSAVNGPSITNAEFLETFARVFEERDRISNQLVLTFTQADLEQFSPSAWQALGDMQAFGFRFALSQIDHVAMDFAALATRGFAFLRLEASALTHGLPARDRFMEAPELCKHLAGAGMTIVADTIDDEAIRARVFGFGILFGQGRLFGGARQVKLDQLPNGSAAAA